MLLKALLIAMALSEGADVATTKAAFDRGCIEGQPALWPFGRRLAASKPGATRLPRSPARHGCQFLGVFTDEPHAPREMGVPSHTLEASLDPSRCMGFIRENCQKVDA